MTRPVREQPPTERPPCGRRGFVLPIVILLVVMVGAVSAIMLDRHVARSKTVQRQIDAYQEHHGVRSLQTVIEAWRKTPTAQPRDLADMLEDDGLALSVEPGDSTRIEIYLFPGQDTLLGRVGGLRQQERDAAERAIRVLASRVESRDELDLYLRDAGPLAVDVAIASPLLIESIVGGVLGEGPEARAYSQRLVETRLSGEEIGLQTLSNIATESGIDSDQRALINRFFTVSPEVWRFRVDVRATGVAAGLGIVSQYAGLIRIGSSTNPAGSTFEEPTPFLSWERLNPDDPRAVE
jgi:hypothetical protein